jgi:acetyl-CoA carboxylase biotin carboxyl carrier protein
MVGNKNHGYPDAADSYTGFGQTDRGDRIFPVGLIADRNLVAAELRLRDIKKAVHQITEVMVMSVEVRAPMPGKILEVLVKVGDQVKEDDEVIMLEAMKMENPIYAPADGTVKEIKVKANDSVETEQVMMVIG